LLKLVVVDAMNKRIIRLLMADGRMTYNDIAAKLRRSPSTVRDRIRRLEDDKVILGYYAIINAERMGLKSEALLRANLAEGKGVEDLRRISKIEGVKEVCQVSGERRVLLRLLAEDNRSLEYLVHEKIIPLGLIDVELQVVLESALRPPGI
jgi:DNA-binding Lrp family transcriptional regulator